MSKVRVRYAPSPTGHLHIGGARTALFNYLFAKHYDGDFIIRIEDTDIERNIEGGEASQLENLKWLGITPDESPVNPGLFGPYRQTERLDIYQSYTDQLIERGLAYKCYCDTETLEKEREAQLARGEAPMYSGHCRHLSDEEKKYHEENNTPFAVRVAVPENKLYQFDDLVRGHVQFESKDIGDWVLVKTNGIPTYNYAVAIDDYLMEITHVFRGEEHLSNTPKQMMIYEAFNWDIPTFAHMTLIVNEQRKKLSKRDESIIQFVSQYKDLGYLPEALFNFIALLGWSPEGEEEIFTKEQLIELFNEKRLSKSPSMFDTNKLAWINNRYIKKLSLDEVVTLCKPFLEKAYDLSNKTDAWVEQLIAAYQEQLSFGAEIVDLVKVFFVEKPVLDEEATAFMNQDGVNETVRTFKEQLQSQDEFTIESIKEAMNQTKTITGAKGKMLFMPLRIAATGQMHGPDFATALILLGKDLVIERLARY